MLISLFGQTLRGAKVFLGATASGDCPPCGRKPVHETLQKGMSSIDGSFANFITQNLLAKYNSWRTHVLILGLCQLYGLHVMAFQFGYRQRTLQTALFFITVALAVKNQSYDEQ